ncbi:hypothetical protein RB595_004143 [Gaeumannomyces hyphopodioides]
MHEMLAPAALPAGITPAPTLAPAVTHGLMRRQTTHGCLNIGPFNCDGGIGACIQSVGFRDNSTRAATSCYCDHGPAYLQCFHSALTSKCPSYGDDDFAYYQISWFSSMCGSVPATAMAQIKPPSTVVLSLSTVESVRLSSRSTPPPRTSTPQFTSTGKLLDRGCDSASYTLIDSGSTVYWAGFVGCINDRPECCPWTIANTIATDAPPATQDGGVNTQRDNSGGAYPSPKDGVQSVLANCADDYYSISGSCCPNGFFPFTRAVAGQTPCWSSANRITAAPTLTANVVGQPIDTEKPTSAVLNVVLAIQYAVAPQEGSSGLSLPVGAIVGISLGGAAIILALVLAWFCIRRKRRAGRGAGSGQEGGGSAVQMSEEAAPAVPVMMQAKSAQGAPAGTMVPNDPVEMGTAPPQGHDGAMFTPRTPIRPQYDPLPTASPPRQNYDDTVFVPPASWTQQEYHQLPTTSPTRQGYNGGVLAPLPSTQQQSYQPCAASPTAQRGGHSRHISSVTAWSASGMSESEVSSVGAGDVWGARGIANPGEVFVPRYQDGVDGQQRNDQAAFSPSLSSPTGGYERAHWQNIPQTQ